MTAATRTRTAGGRRRGNATDRAGTGNGTTDPNAWGALWAMMVGFFMILVDSTIVAVANPSIMAELDTGYDTVIWVTSAYLLAYAVPLLVAGRLGDRFGPKNLYVIGLATFATASLWCGLSGSIQMLITARVVQGIGAAVLTPQTLTLITRIFPRERRGVAMSVWGATAGVATLVGPLAGGLLVDSLGWAWIFFVNVPIGIIGLALAVWLLPVLPTHQRRFDLVGVGLSGAGASLVVFALQEGQSHSWAPWIWAVIVAGIGFVAAFVYWQSINADEPLIPLEIFGDRDFSLSNVAVAVISFAATAMILPLMFYTQAVCGLSPTRSALVIAPMALAGGVLAPAVGTLVDRSHPRTVVGFGFSALAIALTWLSIEMSPTTPIWRLLLVFTVLGVAMAFIWTPLTATATHNLPANLAGASSGVYNATRQFGAVLGSASIAAFMPSRITAQVPPVLGYPPAMQDGEGVAVQLPEFLRAPFAAAMSQSMLLPAFVALAGVAAALFMVGFTSPVAASRSSRRLVGVGAGPIRAVNGFEARTEVIPVLPRGGLAENALVPGPRLDTERERSTPVESCHRASAEPSSAGEPVRSGRNGFHIDHEAPTRTATSPPGPRPHDDPVASRDDHDGGWGGAHSKPHDSHIADGYGRAPRHKLTGDPPRNRHYLDDSATYGRHSLPERE